MLEKSRNAVFFQWFVCRVSRIVGLLKRRVRRSVLRGEIKNCTPLWRKAHLQVKMYGPNMRCFVHFDFQMCISPQRRAIFRHLNRQKWSRIVSFLAFSLPNVLFATVACNFFDIWTSKSKTPHVWTTFVCSDVEKLHAAVAKSTFASQNVQNTACLDHFWTFRCRKNCTPLWRKAHSEVKMLKNWRSGTTFVCSDVEKLHAAVAKCTFESQNVQNTACLDHFWTFRCRKIARHCGEKHIRKWKC